MISMKVSVTSTAQTLLHTARDRGRNRAHQVEMLEEVSASFQSPPVSLALSLSLLIFCSLTLYIE
jgi:hypothetical protein